MRVRSIVGVATAFVATLALASRVAAQSGEEPIVITHHRVTIAGRVLRYTARAGRIPIRDNEVGDVHGQMFFVSYTLDRTPGDPLRPVTFVWNGGPGSNAALVHLIGFGPKRIAPARGSKAGDGSRWISEPNPGTWLTATDLVFVDPIGTGYSRPSRVEYAKEFYQTRGDAESVAEFIRVYRTRFDAFDAPVFLAGESFGVTRAAGVAAALERRSTDVRGVILLGLALPLATPSPALRTALGVPSMAVAAFANSTLSPELQRDVQATMRQAESWATSTYAPALARRDSLTESQRDSIVSGLSSFTGLDRTVIDRRTLVVDRMQVGNYLLRRQRKYVGQYDTRMVGPLDTTQTEYDPTKDPSLQNLLDDVMVLRYLRDELGYRSDLRYQGPFGGGYPPPTSPRGDWMSVKWAWAPDDSVAGRLALREAMRLNPTLRVLTACGFYDLVCDYYGNVWGASHLDDSTRANVVARSYAGGHAMYTDPRAHEQLARDVTEFIRNSSARLKR